MECALGKQKFDRLIKVREVVHQKFLGGDDVIALDGANHSRSSSTRPRPKRTLYEAGPAVGFSKKSNDSRKRQKSVTAEKLKRKSRVSTTPALKPGTATRTEAAPRAPGYRDNLELQSGSHGTQTPMPMNERRMFQGMFEMQKEYYSQRLAHDQAGAMAAASIAHQSSTFLEKLIMKQTEMNEHERAKETLGIYVTNQAVGSRHAYNSGESFETR